MKGLLYLSIFISSEAFSIDPLKYIEGHWRGTYEEDVQLKSTFVIKEGYLSLTEWDCKNNKLELIEFKEVDNPGHDSAYAWWLKSYYEITVKVDFNRLSKGCPNNPNIFKYYKFAPAFESPLKIRISTDSCAKYLSADMTFGSFSGVYRRTDSGEPPLECDPRFTL